MGSWNEYCSLSGISIGYGQSAYIVPLKPAEYNQWDRNNKYNIFNQGISHHDNSLTGGLWNEVTFPVKGFYDDYGRIIDIIKDENTSAMEEYYKKPIDEIINILTDKNNSKFYEENDEISNQLIKYSTTWFDGEVYDSIEKIDFEQKYLNLGYIKFLEKLGFNNKGINKNNDNRYCHEFNLNNLTIYSDGTCLQNYFPTIEKLEKLLLDNEINIDLKEYKNLNNNQFDYKFSSDFGINKLLLFGNNLWNNPKYMYSDILSSDTKIDIDSAKSFMEFCFLRHLEGKDFYTICSKWKNIKTALYTMGKFLSPVGYGLQCGNERFLKQMLSIFTKRNNKIIKEIEKNY